VKRVSPILGARLLILFAVVVLALSVWGVTAWQRSGAETTFHQSESAELMLTGMLEQQTGARGFALTGEERFLAPYHEGRQFYATALAQARDVSRNDRGLRRSIDSMAGTAKQWQRLAVEQIAQIRRNGRSTAPDAQIDERKRVLDLFKRQNGQLRERLAVARDEQLSRAGTVAALVVLLLSVLFTLVGHVLVQRAARVRLLQAATAARERAEQAEFAEGMLVARDEREAGSLVQRHLERVIPGSDVTVITNGSPGGGLRAMTPLRPDSALELDMAETGPDNCMAIRLSRPHDDGPLAGPLLPCQLCGAQGAQTFCVPAVVGTEVLGSVLVRRPRPFDPTERARVRESVAQSAPVLTNLRTVFNAELRAATDQLTGLPNKRAVQDQLTMMAAQAGRSKTSLAAIVLDLDHFKQVNDGYGHPAGDGVLAAVGAALLSSVRASDFAGRYGGEEFVLLLPDTALEGALVLAEKVRREIELLELPQIEGGLTASLGVAVLPDHAAHADGLLREADRALYAAKARGRNRIEAAPAAAPIAETPLRAAEQTSETPSPPPPATIS
jgi:diguanylate cyclase (GGDEF)-like protein